MIEAFREIAFRTDARKIIEKMIEIVGEYSRQGLRLTARQLYYQFVARDILPNSLESYRKITKTLTNARYAGLIDWLAIEDRGRVPWLPNEWPNLVALTETALRAYRLPRWEDQNTYVELWVEKQALAGVLAPLASRYHVPLSVNKGYASASSMYEAATRIKAATGWSKDRFAMFGRTIRELSKKDARGSKGARLAMEFCDGLKPAIIFYLGDHDPSGEDMVRDIHDRLTEFHHTLHRIEVRKIALTMEQIEEYNPPPNPAKMTDPRAESYVAKHGDQSWEVDALPPDVLTRLISEAFDEVIDRAKLDAVLEREDRDREALRDAVENIEDT